MKKILDLIEFYWKFDNNQQPISSWHDKQDLLKEIEKLQECEHVFDCSQCNGMLTCKKCGKSFHCG